MQSMPNRARRYLAQNRFHRVRMRVLLVLACVVVFCTTYALILPAITMERPLCGLEEHVHTDACYTQLLPDSTAADLQPDSDAAAPDAAVPQADSAAPQADPDPQADSVAQRWVLACTPDNLSVHHHTDACYNEAGELVCGHTVESVHVHTDACYDPQTGEPTCLYADYVAHVHDPDLCFDPQTGELVCQIPELVPHVHNDACYAVVPGQPAHEHGPECYAHERGELVCGLDESPDHVHTDACYAWDDVLVCTQPTDPVPETRELVCGMPEVVLHTHTEACYNEAGELACGQVEVREHVHSAECLQAVEEPAAPQEPAVPDDPAVPQDPQNPDDPAAPADPTALTCGLEEGPDHTHTARCYGTWVLTCQLPEHVHTPACYGESDPHADEEGPENWEATLPAELSGDWVANLLAVARSQLGYSESVRNFQLGGDDGQTVYGYSRYGEWYGDPYGDWCAMFVSFCLHYAGITEDQVPLDANCQSWIGQFEARGQFAAPAGYDPRPGDLVFFDYDHDGVSDHVGIVAERPEGQVVTIEGNSANCVRSVAYDLAYEGIAGYAALAGTAPDPKTSLTAQGDGFSITVSFGPEAAVPANAQLHVSEYPLDSDAYRARYAEIGELYGWTADQDRTADARLFSMGLFVDEQEVQPAAAVDVRVTYTDQGQAADYAVTHFAADGSREAVPARSGFADGAQTVDFSLAGFSDVMVVANGPSYLILSAADTQTVPSFRLWMWEWEDGSYVRRAAYPQNGIADALRVADPSSEADGAYLLPIAYFEQAYGQGAVQVEAPCPFKYAPRADDSQADLTSARYVQVVGRDDPQAASWYVMVRDEGTYGDPPRSNVYFDANRTDAVVTDAVSPGGTVINLFDYSVHGSVFDPESQAHAGEESGINAGHALKFTAEGFGGAGQMNRWTGSNGGVLQGIVADRLVGGYPELSGTAVANGSTQSLDYLFDPAIAVTGDDGTVYYKRSCRDVGNLLQVSEDGYFYFDSTRNYAEYDPATNDFILYDDWAVTGGSTQGQFFPFTPYSSVTKQTSSSSDALNHYLGLTLTTRFIQQYGGHVDASDKRVPTTFQFSGDDDVWIFIDGVLVADLGGIHDAAGVTIDFAAGTVTISRVYGKGSDVTTTFADAFAGTGVQLNDAGTLVDNTYHTLKFFYLERGGHASNLSLKYNLSSYPPVSLYKTDQYGNGVGGAQFSVYRADADYQKLDAEPVYTLTTNEDGSITFTDPDNAPHTMDELREMFGEHFILEETGVPSGYRITGTRECRMHFLGSALVCDNPQDTGVWAVPDVQVTAPATLTTADGGTIDYYGSDGAHGTLFMVVLKYMGAPGEEGLLDRDSWVPLAGNIRDGFYAADTSAGYVAAAIDIAQAYPEGQGVFRLSTSGQMQATLTSMPGDIRTYYYLMPEAERANAKYAAAYYWSSASSLAEANPQNTVLVDATYEGGSRGFSRVFGSTIRIPNMINSVVVQKKDVDGTPVNGARFAIYPVSQDAPGEPVWYLSTEGPRVLLAPYADDPAARQATVEGSDASYTYSVDAASGAIWVLDANGSAVYSIAPGPYGVDGDPVAVTGDPATPDAMGESGTACFSYVDPGMYLIREVAAPAGYQINPAEVMVRVSSDSIYANAGTADDGVTVARGPGYIASTMRELASPGIVDQTLRWISTELYHSGPSSSFDDANLANSAANWQTAGPAYLMYNPQATQSSVASYVMNADRYTAADPAPAPGAVEALRLSTDVGWTYLQIYQDYAYGSATVEPGVTYRDWSGHEITRLFARSIFIEVANKKAAGSLEVSKQVLLDSTEAAANRDFSFTVVLTQGSGDPLADAYPCTFYQLDDAGNRTPLALDAPVASVGIDANGAKTLTYAFTLKHNQLLSIDGLPAGTLYSVAEKPTAEYATSATQKIVENGVPGVRTWDGAGPVTGELYWHVGDDGAADVVSEVRFTNSRLPDLGIVKKDVATSGDATRYLEGAQFQLYRLEGSDGQTPSYYWQNGDQNGWTPDAGDAATVLVTGADGRVTLSRIPDGRYFLKEIKAPDGYLLPANAVVLNVQGGAIVSAVPDKGGLTCEVVEGGLAVVVPNSSGVELPSTGGPGSAPYVVAGLVCVCGVLLYLAARGLAREGDG